MMIRIKNVLRWQGRIAVAVLMAVSMLSLAAAPTYAETADANSVQMTLSPTKTKLALDPGESKQGTFRIINTGKGEFSFKVYASPYQVTNEKYDPTFNVETNRTQIARWITVPGEEYTLQAGAETEVPYTVNVPKDVPSGGQYAVIFAETTSDSADNTSIVAKKRIGMLLYGNISGDTREQGEIASWEMLGWQHTAPLTAQYRVKNTGNTDFAVTTQMTVRNIWGGEVYASEEVENTVLPDTTRAVELTWDKAGVGLYKVSTSVKYLDKSQADERLVLVMSPVLAVIIVVVIVLVIGGAVYAARKRRKRSEKA